MGNLEHGSISLLKKIFKQFNLNLKIKDTYLKTYSNLP